MKSVLHDLYDRGHLVTSITRTITPPVLWRDITALMPRFPDTIYVAIAWPEQ